MNQFLCDLVAHYACFGWQSPCRNRGKDLPLLADQEDILVSKLISPLTRFSTWPQCPKFIIALHQAILIFWTPNILLHCLSMFLQALQAISVDCQAVQAPGIGLDPLVIVQSKLITKNQSHVGHGKINLIVKRTPIGIWTRF